MKTSKKQINILASVIGLILTASTVFISASSEASSTDSMATSVALAAQSTATPSGAESAGTTSVSGTSDTSETPATQTAAQVATNTSGYTNGTYAASDTYQTPGSSESIGVTLTLKDGIITDASLTQSGNDHDSARYQDSFASAYKSYVVGKSISGLALSTVSGSSLTTSAFDSAVSQIASQAQA